MDVEVISERENPLLGRREVRLRVKYPGLGVPNRQEVRNKIIAVLDSNKDLTVVDSIKPEYGRHSSIGYVKIYENAGAMKIEAEHKIDRNFKPKEKKPAEAAAEAKAEKKVSPTGGHAPEMGQEK
ncbi:MAG: 30S ribosomal protein S24e [Candidatus Altiarchaeota archaeon]